jgi:glutathione S-transferase
MSTLTLYTNPHSRGRIARWMLEEIGVPYQAVVLPYGPGMKTPEYLAINPMGKVPTLVHGDAVVTEVAAILAYLADVFPQAGLAPPSADHAARAAYWRWLFFAAGPMEAAITDQALGVKVEAQQQGFVGYGNAQLAEDTLAAALAGRRYIAGERFSAADVYLCAKLDFALAFGNLPRRPEFLAYCAAHAERPAKRRAAALDDAAAKP